MTDWQAGPELDAEIARLVFGWTGCQLQDGLYAGYPPNSGQFTFGPQYSQLIQAAWLVVEKMRERGYLVRVQEHPDGFPFYLALRDDNMPDERSRVDKRAMCLIEGLGPKFSGSSIRGPGYGQTAAEAICRAALSVAVR